MEKIDQRVKLTQTLLKNSLIELLQKEHLSKISVRGICEVAGINRSTFYLHYNDTYDLFNQIINEVIFDLNNYLTASNVNIYNPISKSLFTMILQYLKSNKKLFIALLSDNSNNSLFERLMNLEQIDIIQSSNNLDLSTKHYIKIYGINGCVSVIQKWLQSDTEETCDFMADLIIKMLFYGISKV